MNQKIVRFLFISYILFALYNTLIPFSFDYGFADLARRLNRVSLTPYFVDGKRVSLTDIVGNIILFIPFGFLFCLLCYYRGNRFPVLLATIAGLMLSLAIEFLQLFIKTRDSAIHDLINNALGSWMGAVIAYVYARKISNISRKIFYDILESKPYLLIIVFVALAQFVSSVMPFTVSISVSSLAESVKEMNIVPFTYKPLAEFFGFTSAKTTYQITDQSINRLTIAGFPEDVLANLESLKNQPGLPKEKFLKTVRSAIGKEYYRDNISLILQNSETKNPEYFRLNKFFENILFWMAIGYVVMLCYRLYWQNTAFGSLFLWVLSPGYFLFLEGFQIIISSRISDINDIISGYGGVLLGYVLYSMLPPSPQSYIERNVKMLTVPVVMYTIFVFYSGFLPFDWSFTPEAIARDLIPENLIPFYAYFRKTSLWNIYDLANSLAYFIPISLYVSYSLKQAGKSYVTIYLFMALAGLISGSLIEVSQLFSHQRMAEITDILAFGGGGVIGTFLFYYCENQVMPTLHEIHYGFPKIIRPKPA